MTIIKTLVVALAATLTIGVHAEDRTPAQIREDVIKDFNVNIKCKKAMNAAELVIAALSVEDYLQNTPQNKNDLNYGLEKLTEANESCKGGVTIGMTKAQVLKSSWGKPSDINNTITKGGKSEQWVYGSGSYLYFINNKLTAIQN